MQWFIGGCKEDGLRPNMVEVRDDETRKKVEIYQLYEEQCQREGVVDFGELMLRSFEVLRDNDPIREHYQRRFRHILIDEFQDTNKLQYAWIKMLAGTGAHGSVDDAASFNPSGCVLAVGDDDQSIYAFRGARVGNMADFVREFKVQHQIKLEENYRSGSNILDSANELISHNSKRLGKNLRTSQGPGEPVRVFEATSDFAEAQWMVDEMRQLVRDDVPRKEIAVLYRSNAQSRVIETALFNHGVPYKVYGGLRFFERAEIKNALAYLRLLENPRDDTSFLRVVNFPPRGIGAAQPGAVARRGARQWLRLERRGQRPRRQGRHQDWRFSGRHRRAARADAGQEAARDRGDDAGPQRPAHPLPRRPRRRRPGREPGRAGQRGRRALCRWKTLAVTPSLVPMDDEGQALTQSPASQGLDFSQPFVEEAAPDAETGETLSPLAAFLSHAALEAGDNQAQAGQDAIQLMTVHSSKGLEFDCVFITGMEEGLFPHENSMSDRDGSGGRAPPDVRGHHPRAQAPVPEPLADPHAARPDALQPEKPLL